MELFSQIQKINQEAENEKCKKFSPRCTSQIQVFLFLTLDAW